MDRDARFAARGGGPRARVRTELFRMSPNSDELARIAELVAGGDVRVETPEVLLLTEVRRGHQLGESGHTRASPALVS